MGVGLLCSFIFLLQQRPQLRVHVKEGAAVAVKGIPTGKGRPQSVRLKTNSACLHKRLPTVFTASTHFCFTATKLFGRLFCLT